MKTNIKAATIEALDIQNISKTNKLPNKMSWFSGEMKKKCKKKRVLHYLQEFENSSVTRAYQHNMKNIKWCIVIQQHW